MRIMSQKNNDVQAYEQTRDHYLSNAEKRLNEGDYRKASELLWGAVTQQLKLLAALNGKVINSHREFDTFIDEVVEETGNEDFAGLYGAAERLHRNFYDEVIQKRFFQGHAERAIRLILMLETLVRKYHKDY